ncbi:transcription antitermination regulator [Pilimelia anulata]|uniref:Transcription antitermination regulator n=1 Tax=Pilimelia anulata TaxID=53371 RepID=A0A8J3BC30_9ACTN|nr:SpoIIE family protein phosphatase [Pilimelia anulata]GGK02996.1 transcription antitermination regulator [Pilimelia anulata]
MAQPAGAGRAGPAAPPDPARSAGRLAATVDRLRAEVTRAHAAADGRALIDLAKGVLIARFGYGPVEASRQLADLARDGSVSQLALAADIVNQAARDQVTDATRAFLQLTSTMPDADEASAVTRLRTAQASALTTDDALAVAGSLLAHALAPLGASAVAIWMAGPDGSLSLAGAAGFPAAEVRSWRFVPPGVATPARTCLADRRTVHYPSLGAAGLPSIGGRQQPDSGRTVVPAGTGGRIAGVLEICWPRPTPEQSPRVQRQFEALAELCAHTLERAAPPAPPGDRPPAAEEIVDFVDGLEDAALVLVPEPDADGQPADFRIAHANPRFVDPAGRPRAAVAGARLLEVYPMAAGAYGLFEMVERVYATGEPFRAERMTITALVDQVPLRGAAGISIARLGGAVVLSWRVDDESARLARLLQHAQRLGRIGGFEEHIGTGDIAWNSQLHELYGLPAGAGPIPLARLARHAHADDAGTVERFLRTVLHHRRPASTAFRLHRPDGIVRHIRVVAEPVLDGHEHMVGVRGAYQDISAQHWTEVALAATREQLAHTAQESAERNRLALQLQHAIMPPTQGPIEACGLRVGVRYRPAEKDHLVGGDWYDAVVLPSKQVLLCVGDIAGHGIDAATGMVVLRNALRGLATTGAGPGQLLAWLNVVAHHLTKQVTATAVCGLYDPDSATLRWARAGHLPPVLVSGGAARMLPQIPGILLGALADSEYAEHEVQLGAADTLLMYTDGLIERRGDSLEDALSQLLDTAARPATGLDNLLEQLLTFTNADTDDDTCIIAVQRD